MDRGLKLYGLGMQGSEGNQTGEKPAFYDVIGGLKFEAWEDYRGIDKEYVQKMFIVFASKLLTEEGFSEYLVNQIRPGPDYYSECKEWNWVDQLVDNHKVHLSKDGKNNVYGIELSDAELEQM